MIFLNSSIGPVFQKPGKHGNSCMLNLLLSSSWDSLSFFSFSQGNKMSKKPNIDYITRIALAILQGKFYHVFIDGIYLRSFYHSIAAGCWKIVKDARVIYIGRG
jgi:hypothetical protein